MTLLTKQQGEMILANMKVSLPLPQKGKAVIVAFPYPARPNTLKITKTDFRATYGGKLYAFEYSHTEARGLS